MHLSAGTAVRGWAGVTLVLCAFGLLREIRPSEPFVTEFLLGKWRNVSQQQVNQEVYPTGTYSYLAQLVLVFLLTDYLRFNPIILISGICGIVVYAILLWTTSLEWLQVSQFVYGLYMATEIAYYTYIFAKVDSKKYARVSSYTRMAALIGRFLSGLSADLLTRFRVMDYRQLNYVTFTAQILATFWALWLPPVQYSVYFHRKDSSSTEIKSESHCQINAGCREQIAEAFNLITRHTRTAYSRGKVIQWSGLYAVSMCLFVQAQYYVQFLWIDIQDGERKVAYNGLVEAALTIVGAGGAWMSSRAARSLTPGPLAAVQAMALFAATYPNNIYLAYAGYVVVGVLYHYIITLASTKIAHQLRDDSCFGLIFGINTLVGTALQSLLTVVIISQAGLALDIRQQFYTVSACYLVLAVTWTLVWSLSRHTEAKETFNENYVM